MSNKKEVETEVEETEDERYYVIRAKGDIYITINAGRGAVVNTNAGQAQPPIRPPHG